MSKLPELQCRYQLGDDMWHLNVYNLHEVMGAKAVEFNQRAMGRPGGEPDWLKTVIAVATVGDHFTCPVDPPPYKVLWFTVTPDKQLKRFGYA